MVKKGLTLTGTHIHKLTAVFRFTPVKRLLCAAEQLNGEDGTSGRRREESGRETIHLSSSATLASKHQCLLWATKTGFGTPKRGWLLPKIWQHASTLVGSDVHCPRHLCRHHFRKQWKVGVILQGSTGTSHYHFLARNACLSEYRCAQGRTLSF